mmetsp:Transcript_73175/g.210130  ORF Transcript_73175/g.210130 Transcript_73175/m.210130 type:complete len:311 (+) Transcript_73175:154-1086(+)
MFVRRCLNRPIRASGLQPPTSAPAAAARAPESAATKTPARPMPAAQCTTKGRGGAPTSTLGAEATRASMSRSKAKNCSTGGALWSRHHDTASWGPFHSRSLHLHRSGRTTTSAKVPSAAAATADAAPLHPASSSSTGPLMPPLGSAPPLPFGRAAGDQYGGKSMSSGSAAPLSMRTATGCTARTMSQKSAIVFRRGCCVTTYESAEGTSPEIRAALMYGTPTTDRSTPWPSSVRLPVGRSKPRAFSSGDQSGRDDGQRRRKCWCRPAASCCCKRSNFWEGGSVDFSCDTANLYSASSPKLNNSSAPCAHR